MAEVYTVVNARRVVQYDGTNSAELDDLIPNMEVRGVTAEGMEIVSSNIETTVRPGMWICYWQDGVVSVMTEAELSQQYVVLSDSAVATP